MRKSNRNIKNKFINRTFAKIFLMFVACIFVVEIILLAHSYQKDLKVLSDKNREKEDEVIENVVDYLQTLINDEKILNTTVSDTEWSIMLGAESDIFDEKITYKKLLQLTEDFLFYIPTGSVLDSRAVFFMKRDIMLTRSYYGAPSYFLKTQGISTKYQKDILDRIAAAEILTKIDCFDENGNNVLGDKIMLATPLFNKKYGNGYTVTLIDLKKLEKAILPMLSDSFSEVRIYDCDSNEIFFAMGEGQLSQKNVRSEAVQISGINWAVEFVINDTVLSVGEMFLENQGTYIALIIVTTMIAIFLTIYVYAPIKKIANKLPGAMVGKDVYQAIEHSVDKMVLELAESRRQDLLHQLLAGYFDDVYEENTKDFPVQEETWVKVLVITNQNSRRYEELEQYKLLLAETDVTCMMMQAINGNFIVLLGNELRTEVEQVSSKIVNFYSLKPTEIFAGRMEKGLLGISKSYQSAIEKMQFVNGIIQPRYFFPVDWKTQWSVALRQGKREVAEEIMQEVFSENHRRLEKGEIEKYDFYHLFQRILEDMRICIKETGVDENILEIENFYMAIRSVGDDGMHTEMKELLDIQKEIILLEGELCSKIVKRMDFNMNYNREIIDYIEEHLSNPELSVVFLEGVFSISANTINKTVKYYTGRTFLPYLTYCRMELAKKLLLQDIKILFCYSTVANFMNLH